MIGEIVNLSGAGLFNGYHNDPEATAQRMRGGIYHSGDLGWVDAAGYVYFAGRLGDWVRVDGENLGTAPIERILLRHQAITAAAVFGVPAEVGDEVVAALVVDERRAGTGLSGTDLFDFLAAQQDLGPKQWPHRVVLVDALPQTATFKTVRRELAALAEIPTWVRTPTGYRAP